MFMHLDVPERLSDGAVQISGGSGVLRGLVGPKWRGARQRAGQVTQELREPSVSSASEIRGVITRGSVSRQLIEVRTAVFVRRLHQR